MNRIIVGLISAAIITFIGYFVFQTIKSSPQEWLANDAETSNMDEEKLDLQYGIQGGLSAYAATNKNFPEASESGWNQFVATVRENRMKNDPNNEIGTKDPYIDPYTNTDYEFTRNSPEYGQIQYRSSSSCDAKREEFSEAKAAVNYAFRLKYSDGIRCATNL